jgi:hypothetical protein
VLIGAELGKPGIQLTPGVNPFEAFIYRNDGLPGNATPEYVARQLGLNPDDAAVRHVLDLLQPLLKPYHREEVEVFKRREFIHPAGFYPGDRSSEGAGWQQAYRQNPNNTPALKERRWLGNVNGKSGGYIQTYGSTNPGTRSAIGASRYISDRIDNTSYLYREIVTKNNGQVQVSQSGTVYGFTQAQARVKFSTASGFGADVASYSEAGTNAFATSYPQGIQPSDWWLSNGKIVNNVQDPTQQSRSTEFAALRMFGYELKGESLLPAMGDTTARVFMRVPNANVNFANEHPGQLRRIIAIPPSNSEEYVTSASGKTYQLTLQDRNDYRTQTTEIADKNFLQWLTENMPFSEKQNYISVANMAALMTQLASRSPAHIELAYVTPDQLIQKNKDRLYTIVDPTTGVKTLAFKVGDWIDTSLLQVNGHPGLYVQKDTLNKNLFNANNQIELNESNDLPHWKAHQTNDNLPALTTPRVLQMQMQGQK